jgi:signal transduction histidine kinase
MANTLKKNSMDILPREARLLKRAYWLIKFRWSAVVSLCVAIFVADVILNISVQTVSLYVIAGLLAVYNTIVLLLLNYLKRTKYKNLKSATRKIINFQMAADLFLLMILLHFSGGIENPFIMYFVFHMIIASIILSVAESYMQATFATVLLVFLATLEYKGIVDHYCLRGFLDSCHQSNAMFIFGTVAVIASALYLVVHMTGSISIRLRKREEALWEANLQLKQKDRIKNEYVARVTHDIKGHLAVIKMSLDVAGQESIGTLNVKQEELVTRANVRTTKLIAFVQALLKLTKMRLSDEINMEVFNISETLANSAAAARAKAKDKEVELKVSEINVDREVLGNQVSIEEVTTNLLLNAIKYTPSDGIVMLIVSEKDGFLQVDVEDTGMGIPPDELPKVFDEFYRASNARATERDGTGLGLSIAKQVIERHGGKIWAKSHLGQG